MEVEITRKKKEVVQDLSNMTFVDVFGKQIKEDSIHCVAKNDGGNFFVKVKDGFLYQRGESGSELFWQKVSLPVYKNYVLYLKTLDKRHYDLASQEFVKG